MGREFASKINFFILDMALEVKELLAIVEASIMPIYLLRKRQTKAILRALVPTYENNTKKLFEIWSSTYSLEFR